MLSSHLVKGFTVPRVLTAKELLNIQSLRRFSTDLAALHHPEGLLRRKVKKIFEGQEVKVGDIIKVQGWVRTVRDQKKFAFIEVNDGSSLQSLQVVADADIATYSEVGRLTTGSAVDIEGTIVESVGKGQKVELKAQIVTLVGGCPADTYPLQKKRHSQEFLRTIAHLRARTNTISAVSRVRSALAFATHEFFQSHGFVYLQSPLITSSDCEGAGEMFRVTTLPIDNPKAIPVGKDGQVDFAQDFFCKPAYLTVSGQLSGETYACALGDIYTFGPTFRAEKSQTTRHLAEFHMIEPELAFADLHAAMDNAEAFVQHVVRYVLHHCKDDLDFFNKLIDKTALARLNKLINEPFVRVPYSDAVSMLQEEIRKDPSKWVYPDVSFGTDLQTEHERWLAEEKFQSCVFVHNYPRHIKAFYMRDNADNQTVDSFDLLVPGVGELIGGSQREERLDVLVKKMEEFKLNPKDYDWYLDLRRFGSVPHAGYGLGFERLVCYVTGIENIREAIAYPRYPGHAQF
ncbi:asparagine--tRNA ligase [archaeon]|nr:MAG: asparagine--tRNA ligase [archaeon]